MKILLTGGGSGGHFYPIIAVAEQLNKLAGEERLVDLSLFYMSDDAYDKNLLADNKIQYLSVSAGKLRRYFSFQNFVDIFKTGFGVIKSFWTIFKIFPDVVFGKGGYASFPALLSARIFGIPVMIHESDSVPGKVNRWAGKFAKTVAVSYPEAAKYFPSGKAVCTGNPIRQSLMNIEKEGATTFLKLEENVPVILILGGSLGAKIINETIVEILPKLLQKYQIIHQTGKDNFAEITQLANVILEKNQFAGRYKPFAFLNSNAMKMCAGVANLVISRAGSTIFEIANWGIPSIIIPISDSNGDHQRENAFNYARSGGAVVVEEANLGGNVLIFEIDRLFGNSQKLSEMSRSAKSFSRSDSALVIAQAIIDLGLSHEK